MTVTERRKLTTSPTMTIRTTEADMAGAERAVLGEVERQRKEWEKKLRACAWLNALNIPFSYSLFPWISRVWLWLLVGRLASFICYVDIDMP